mmetsp:Transcript_29414/g.53979  ORF Transcript_29414/g.53979 Transcript_29414/m.53979 type:complete len:207 (-) Transcript_29414:93-713(-)
MTTIRPPRQELLVWMSKSMLSVFLASARIQLVWRDDWGPGMRSWMNDLRSFDGGIPRLYDKSGETYLILPMLSVRIKSGIWTFKGWRLSSILTSTSVPIPTNRISRLTRMPTDKYLCLNVTVGTIYLRATVFSRTMFSFSLSELLSSALLSLTVKQLELRSSNMPAMSSGSSTKDSNGKPTMSCNSKANQSTKFRSTAAIDPLRRV